MRLSRRRSLVGLLAVVVIALQVVALGPGGRMFAGLGAARAEEPVASGFARTWARTDGPVADLLVDRTWMWGPQAFSAPLGERYAEAPGGERVVQYFDKSRMEINHDRDVPEDSPWRVTNGLLVVELITGRLQLGDDEFVAYEPARVNVAGDPNDATGPTYATFGSLLDAPPLADGASVVQRLARDGGVSLDPVLAARGVTAAYRVQQDGIDHQVASVFWSFMNSTGIVYEDGQYVEDRLFANPFYATGLPVSEPYWATVRVAGVPRDVLAQCFERRCLTYTPDNPPGWQVEAGNVGQHYFAWRASLPGETPEPAPTPTPQPTLPPTPTATVTATPPIDQGEASCLNSVEAEVLRLLNVERQSAGLAPLTNSRKLNAASYYHSLDMATNEFFSHYGSDGSSLVDRVREVGYTGWTAVAENIAAGYPSAASVVDGWMNSPGHRENILDGTLTQVGVGLVETNTGYMLYWTTDFGNANDPGC